MKEEAEKGNKKPRRDYGEGSLYHRESDNRWVGSFFHNGERKYVYGSVGGKKSEALKKLKEAKAKADAGQLVASNKQKVAEYLEHWLSAKEMPRKINTNRTQSSHVRCNIIPSIGHIHLQKLTRQHVQQMIKDLVEDGLEPSTIHSVYTIFNTAMNDAVEWQFLAVNPCKHIALPRVEDRDYLVLTQEQVQTFLQSLKGSPIEAMVTLALATGMRRGECLALKWSDIDLAKGRLRVQRNLVFVRGEGYREISPKTKSSKRTITLTQTACEVLKEHKRKQSEDQLHAPAWQDLDLVFPRENGSHMAYTTLTMRFKRALKTAGLPPEFRFHDLRHTCATLLLSMGAAPKVVQELLGHSSIRTTLDLYGHVIPGMAESVMEKYDIFLRQESAR